MKAKALLGRSEAVIALASIIFLVLTSASCAPQRTPHVQASIENNFRVAYIAAAPDTAAHDCVMLVTAGYTHGIEPGMEGRLWQMVPEFRRKSPARLQVIESEPHLSLCHAWGVTPGEPVRSVRVSFTQDKRLPQEVLATADSVFSEGDYERAFYLYRQLQMDTVPLADGAVKQNLDYCAKQLDARQVGLLDPQTRTRYAEQLDFYRRLADNFVLYCAYDAASEYLFRILRVAPEDEEALQLFGRLDSGDVFQPFFRDRWDTRYFDSILPDSIKSPDEQFQKYPTMIVKAAPEYPSYESLIMARGTVKVKALVDSVGNVVIAGVEMGSGHTGLDEAAARAAYECKFTPAIRSGKNAQCWVLWDYAFQLWP